MDKKYAIISHVMSDISETDIFYRDIERISQEGNIFDSFNEAKKNLLYGLKESIKQLDEEDNDEFEQIKSYNSSIDFLEKISEEGYKAIYPENFE